MAVKLLSVLSVFLAWYILSCRGDHVEGSRLLEEAFRDYDKRIRPNFGGSAVVVNVSLHVLSIPDIDPAKKTFTLSFYLRQSWTDGRFFFSSRRNIDTLMLDAETSDRIWAPDIFFVNELASIDHSIIAKNQFCRISQNGTVLLSRKITLTASANLDLSRFPYDSHSLVLDLESYGSEAKDLKYQWSHDAISAAPDYRSPGFLIESISHEEALLTLSTGSYSRLALTFKVSRISLPYELKILFPIGTLTVLCLASVFVKTRPISVLITSLAISVKCMISVLCITSFESDAMIGSTTVLNPLVLYSLMSTVFGLTCLLGTYYTKDYVYCHVILLSTYALEIHALQAIFYVFKLNRLVNMVADCKDDKDEAIDIKESKSGTESTSEDFPVQNVSQCMALENAPESLPKKKRCRICSSKTAWRKRLQLCAGHSLTVVLVAMNIIFIIYTKINIET